MVGRMQNYGHLNPHLGLCTLHPFVLRSGKILAKFIVHNTALHDLRIEGCLQVNRQLGHVFLKFPTKYILMV